MTDRRSILGEEYVVGMVNQLTHNNIAKQEYEIRKAYLQDELASNKHRINNLSSDTKKLQGTAGGLTVGFFLLRLVTSVIDLSTVNNAFIYTRSTVSSAMVALIFVVLVGILRNTSEMKQLSRKSSRIRNQLSQLDALSK